MMQKIEELGKIVGLGMAVSLFKRADLITYESIIALPFKKLAEICQTGADDWLRESLLERMEEQAKDFYELKKVYELSPRGEAFSQSRKRRRRVVVKMAKIAGSDFEKMYDICRLPDIRGCGGKSDFPDVAMEVEIRIFSDCHLTVEQGYRMLNDKSEGSGLREMAYQWMTDFLKNEFKDAIK